jgi:hypothetical protein
MACQAQAGQRRQIFAISENRVKSLPNSFGNTPAFMNSILKYAFTMSVFSKSFLIHNQQRLNGIETSNSKSSSCRKTFYSQTQLCRLNGFFARSSRI